MWHCQKFYLKSNIIPVFVNKVSEEHSHAHSISYGMSVTAFPLLWWSWILAAESVCLQSPKRSLSDASWKTFLSPGLDYVFQNKKVRLNQSLCCKTPEGEILHAYEKCKCVLIFVKPYLLCFVLNSISQMTLVVKNPPTNAGDIRDEGLIPWKRPWQPTPMFLPGKFHGQRTHVGYIPQGCKESGRTEAT